MSADDRVDNLAEDHGIRTPAPRGKEAVRLAWSRLRLEAASAAAEEPMLASFVNAAILRHDGFKDALAHAHEHITHANGGGLGRTTNYINKV